MIYSGTYPFIIEKVIKTVSEIRKNNKTAKITFLISSNTMRRALKEYISDEVGILYNLEFFTKIDLAKNVTKVDPINDLQKEIILEKILKDKDLYVEGVEKEYSQTIQKIKETKIDEKLLSENNNLYEIFKTYQQVLFQLDVKDREDVLILASEKEFKTDFLFIFGFQTLTEIDKQLFRNLIENNISFIFIPVDLDSGALKQNPQLKSIFSFFKSFRFKSVNGKISNKNNEISKKIFSKEILKEGINSQNLYFFKSHGKRKELEKIAKEIRDIRDSKKIDWYKIGVIINDTENYINLIKDIFSKYKIPYYLSEENRFIDETGFKKVFTIFKLKENNFKRDTFLNSLSTEILNIDDLNIIEIEKILMENGFEEGYHELIKLIENKGLKGLLNDINNIPEESNILEYCSYYTRILEKYFRKNQYRDKIQDILEILQSNRVFNNLYTEINIEDFNNLILHFLEEENIQNRLKGNIVEVRTPSITAGLLFDYLFFVDMNEGKFPQPVKENPILSDDFRIKLEKKGFPKIDSSYWQQILVFLAVFNSSKNVYLSYKNKDEKGNDLSPSVVFEEIAKYQFGERYFTDGLNFKKEGEIYTLQDFIIENSKHLTNSIPELEKLKEAYQKREDNNLSEYEGNVIFDWKKNNKLSPSKLQDYSDCPYRFLMKVILKIESLEIPDKEKIPVDKEGSVIHKILEDVYKDYIIGKKPDFDKIKNFVEKEFNTEFNLLISKLKPSSQIFEKNRINQVKERVIEFIKWDLDRIEKEKLNPEIIESKKMLKINGFIFTGRIDRADKISNNKYLIYDYKTGKQKVKNLKESLKKGEFLQLFIYKKFLEKEGKEVEKVGLFFVKEFTSRNEVSINIDEELHLELNNNIEIFLNLIKKGYFVPFYKSEICTYCEFVDFCEKFTNEYLEEKSIKDENLIKYLKIKN